MRPHLALTKARQAEVKAQDELGAGSGVDTGAKDETGNEGESEVSETPQAGHNSFAADHLKSIIERVEHMEEEKQAIASDIKDIYAEAKGNGYDVKAMRTIIRMRKQDAGDRAEQEAVLETYMHALGML